MDPAEELKDHEAGIINKVLHAGNQEEIILEDVSTQLELLLSRVEVKVHIKAREELGNGVTVRVRLLLDHLHEVLREGSTGS